jgi:GTPase SAR1 family protein
MPITIIKGPKGSGKTQLANALRNSQITQSQPAEGIYKGALLIDDDNDGETKPLIEKLLNGVELPDEPPADLSKLPWKDDPLIIIVGDEKPVLKRLEKALPGFADFFGPIRTLTTDVLPAPKRAK